MWSWVGPGRFLLIFWWIFGGWGGAKKCFISLEIKLSNMHESSICQKKPKIHPQFNALLKKSYHYKTYPIVFLEKTAGLAASSPKSTTGRRKMLARRPRARIAEILPRIAEILPRAKPRTRTLPTIPEERPTSKRSGAKLPADRRAPELQKRGAAVLPPRGSSINKNKHNNHINYKKLIITYYCYYHYH